MSTSIYIYWLFLLTLQFRTGAWNMKPASWILSYVCDYVGFSEEAFVVLRSVGQEFDDLPPFADFPIDSFDVELQPLFAFVDLVNEICRKQEHLSLK